MADKKARYSTYDTKGKLYVDCSECERGGNGKALDLCSAGARIKRGQKGGCFTGRLFANLTPRNANRKAVAA